MSYNEYWHGNPEKLKYYREMDKINQKRKNFELWLQGRYIYEAIICASPATNPLSKAKKCYPYPDSPFPMSKKEAEEMEEAKRIEQYHAMLDKMKAEYDMQEIKKGGERNGRDN